MLVRSAKAPGQAPLAYNCCFDTFSLQTADGGRRAGPAVMQRLILSTCVLYAVLAGQRSEAAPRQHQVGHCSVVPAL